MSDAEQSPSRPITPDELEAADATPGGHPEWPVRNVLEAGHLYDLHGELEGNQVRIIELRTGDNALVEFAKDANGGILVGTRTLLALSVLSNPVTATEATVEPAPPEAP